MNNSSQIIQAINKFAVNINEKFSDVPGNIFFSPFSIATALSMLLRGVKGETADELRSALNFNLFELPYDDVLKQFDNLLTIMATNNSDYVLTTANAIMIQKQFPFLEDYITDVQKFYKALTVEVDFASESANAVEKINSWVKEVTKNMIPKLFDQLDPDTIMVLLSAIYFKGTWAHQFESQDTHDQPFYNRNQQKNDVPMMHLQEKFLYAEKEDFKALELPYNGDIAMLLLLPHELDGIKNLEEKLTCNLISEIKKDLRKNEVEVTVPKFRLEYSQELEPVLRKLGLKKVFDNGADFSGLCASKMIKVSQVLHKAVIDVNEEGSEAAAVTAVCVNFYSLRVRCPEFRADHPFVFIIYDKRNNFILFMGRVENL